MDRSDTGTRLYSHQRATRNTAQLKGPKFNPNKPSKDQLASGCGNCRFNFNDVRLDHLMRRCRRVGDSGEIFGCPLYVAHLIENCPLIDHLSPEEQLKVIRRFVGHQRAGIPAIRSNVYNPFNDPEYHKDLAKPLTIKEALARRGEFEAMSSADYMALDPNSAQSTAAVPAPPTTKSRRDFDWRDAQPGYYSEERLTMLLSATYNQGRADAASEHIGLVQKASVSAALDTTTSSSIPLHGPQPPPAIHNPDLSPMIPGLGGHPSFFTRSKPVHNQELATGGAMSTSTSPFHGIDPHHATCLGNDMGMQSTRPQTLLHSSPDYSQVLGSRFGAVGNEMRVKRRGEEEMEDGRNGTKTARYWI